MRIPIQNAQHRHDLTDSVWAVLESLLPGQRGQWGDVAKDNRKFINDIFWILRTGIGRILCRHYLEERAIKKHVCSVCGYEYDPENGSAQRLNAFPDWLCPLCGAGNSEFNL